MAEIKNYTLNFGFGRLLRSLDFAGAKSACTAAFGGGFGRLLRSLDFACAKSACTEVQRNPGARPEVCGG
jgi:hypothetical protein